MLLEEMNTFRIERRLVESKMGHIWHSLVTGENASAPSNLPLITKRDKWAISSDIGVLEPKHVTHNTFISFCGNWKFNA